MTSDDTIRESEHESDPRRHLDDEWHEQKRVPVTVLTGDEETPQSQGELTVLSPENDTGSAAVLAIRSPTEDCVVSLEVNPAFVFADQLELVAERASPQADLE
jgi:hypothetical protein